LGGPLALETLPSPENRRWVSRRKAEVEAAVQGGLLASDKVCEHYSRTL
jgi:hypothetical protein